MRQGTAFTLLASLAVTAGLLGAGFWALNRYAPGLVNSSPPGSTSSQAQMTRLTLLGDTFSGYSTFRNPQFLQALQESGIELIYKDEFDQAARAKTLGENQADLVVTTLDQFLAQRPQGKIVGLIDRTVGADAVVLNTRQYPQLKSLLDLQTLVKQRQQAGQPVSMAFAADTPSEFLALVLDTKFDAFNLSDFKVVKVADASEAWKLMQDPQQNIALAVLWEPYVTQARQAQNTVILSSQDAPTSIVDVIVASDRLIQSQPVVITTFLENYYRRIDANIRVSAQLQDQIAQDGNLTPADAATVLRGIEFFTAPEALQWMQKKILQQRIQATAAILVLAGRLSQLPSDPQALYTPEFLTRAATNTQTLIDLVRADNPGLADKLAGAQNRTTPAKPVTAQQVATATNIGNLQVRGEVKFATGSAQLTAASTKTLQALARDISEFNPATVAVRVIGHTSRTGSASFNQSLSQQRAQVVANFLKAEGVKPTVVAEGKGFSQPLSGISPADVQNQRTEIRLVRVN
ncbi:phosphate ABC transporter substrate-binding/OmpA family protein [Thermosynechococcaceae cyanobacterium BACA0444]|uniref:Phosphate ABC transporter substrate-binding/OmpA family protein n=1 Tax=Pseudocalidococcus azoricus BACA0444 TaxID=2918990 RepID=A0AAE4JZL4_9CYAN|nr:phosphate ABC transporter substrate-binding/OmpA family protein [Pseudocalidococcus azoricus]MDS3860967.1 phosphate ABC transporter substrate-binding/OmpA family protein [Pseudocalidococcus azoricus BACA0444]